MNKLCCQASGKGRRCRHRRLAMAIVGLVACSTLMTAELNLRAFGGRMMTSVTGSENDGILPNILLIGTQKSGSTAITTWLQRSGACVGSRGKETQFFHVTKHYEMGPNYYKKQYQKCVAQKKQWILDGTPETLQFPQRVFETYNASATAQQLKDLRIILAIREPIARELSMYNHMLSQHKFKDYKALQSWGILSSSNNSNNTNTPVFKSFEEFVDTVTIPNLSSKRHRCAVAHYSKYLRQWFQLFDPKQILVLHYETDVKANTGNAKQRIADFLNSNPSTPAFVGTTTEGTFPSVNSLESPHKVKQISCPVRDKLSAILEPFNQELYQLLAKTPRPTMEQQPFPKFVLPDCEPTNASITTADSLTTTTTVQ